MSTANALFDPVVQSDQDTGRSITWTVAGVVTVVGALPTDVTSSIACNPGDVVSYFLNDVNSFGTSAPSNTLSDTDPTPPPTAVPTTPVARALTFTNP